MHGAKPSLLGRVLMWVYGILMFLAVPLAFLFYNHGGQRWLLYLGWVLVAAGVAINFAAGQAFRAHGGVPEGKHIVFTTRLVDKGIYGIIRHPQYLGFISIVLGLVLVSQHWLTAICGVLGSLLFYLDVPNEERATADKFGEEYRRYMERVPGWNLLSGLLRSVRRRQG